MSVKGCIQSFSPSVLGILSILLKQIPDLTVDLRKHVPDVGQDDVGAWLLMLLRYDKLLVLTDYVVVSIVERIIEVCIIILLTLILLLLHLALEMLIIIIIIIIVEVHRISLLYKCCLLWRLLLLLLLLLED